MTTKKSTKQIKPKKPAKGNIQVETIVVTPQQIAGFLNRITTALERVEQIHVPQAAAQRFPDEETVNKMLNSQKVQAMQSAQAPPPDGLSQKIFNARDTAQDLYGISQDIVDRLRGGANPANGETGATPSSGPMKDGVGEVRGLMQATIENLRTIGEYIFA